MDKLKQITEFTLDIDRVTSLGLEISGAIAKDLCDIGYRKIEQGEWIVSGYYEGDIFDCSLCGEWSLEKSNYCPHCGAKMKGTE